MSSRIALLALCAAVSTGIGATASHAGPISDPLEGNPGDLREELSNTLPLTRVRVDSIVVGDIFPTSDDTDDAVTGATIPAATDGCSRIPLDPTVGRCAFTLHFTTADASGINDGDSGKWDIHFDLNETLIDVITGETSTRTISKVESVSVVDPAVSEPSSLGLLVSGIAATFIWRRRPRKLMSPAS
jgi:hypothetical protein